MQKRNGAGFKKNQKIWDAWAHIIRHISDIDWRYVGRGESASPAVGSSKIHAKQQLSIVENALAKIK